MTLWQEVQHEFVKIRSATVRANLRKAELFFIGVIGFCEAP